MLAAIAPESKGVGDTCGMQKKVAGRLGINKNLAGDMDLPIPLVHMRVVLPGRWLCRRQCPDAATLALAWPLADGAHAWQWLAGGWLALRRCGPSSPPAGQWAS